MRQSSLTFSLLAVVFFAERVHGVDTLNVVTAVVNDVPPSFSIRNDIFIDFDFYLAEQHLALDLTSGTIVYDACPQCDPNGNFLITSVFLGHYDNPPPPELDFAAMTSTELDVTWSSSPLSILNQDNYHIARIFLSPDAQGTWSYRGEEVHPAAFLPAAPLFRGTISSGVMAIVPEPSAMLLAMTLAATLCWRRLN